MAKSKKSLSTKVVTVFDPHSDDEFEVYVTFSWINNDTFDDYLHHDYDGMINQEDLDIKQFESDNAEDLPEWVTEELVYEALIDELSEEIDDYEEDEEDEYEEDKDDLYDNEDDW